MQAPSGLMMAKRNEGHPTELADLFGKQLIVIAETKDGQRLDEGLVKAVTGGDRIRARRMRENFWEFAPTHLPIVVTNHKPTVRGEDYGIWRRLRLVPFNVTIPPERQDKHLVEKLRHELPAILKWMVEGCLAWQRGGLAEPPCVAAATDAYKADSDILGLWIADCCSTSEGESGRASELYASYRAWCEKGGERAATQKRFSERLAGLGFEKIRDRRGAFYVGISIEASEV